MFVCKQSKQSWWIAKEIPWGETKERYFLTGRRELASEFRSFESALEDMFLTIHPSCWDQYDIYDEDEEELLLEQWEAWTRS